MTSLRLAGACVALAALPAQAEHFYNSWLQEFDRSENNQGQTAAAVAVDSRGNVLVAGNRPSAGGIAQYYVVKYDALDGHIVWSKTVGVSGGVGNQAAPQSHCYAKCIAVDSHDSVIVSGGANLVTGDEEFETIKFDADGTFQWVRVSPANSGQDEARKIVTDSADNVYVTGVSVGQNGTSEDFLTIKYNSGGTQQWSRRFNYKPAIVNGKEIPTDLAVDTGGNVWVVGSVEFSGTYSFCVVNYDSAGTLSAFSPIVIGAAGDSYKAKGIALNSAGTAFVTGSITTSGTDGFYTTKIGSTGIVFGSATAFSPKGDHNGGATSIAIGPDDQPVVTGALDANNNFGAAQGVTIKYEGTGILSNAKAVFPAIVDNGVTPLDNAGLALNDTFLRQVLVDKANNIVVIGDSVADQAFDAQIYVAKYSGVDGHKLFSAFYGADAEDEDLGVGGAIDRSGNIAVVGTEERVINSGGSARAGIATFKFQRILAETGDELPINPTNQKARKITALNAPALSDSGLVAARITEQEGTAKFGAILTQIEAGGSQLGFIQGQPAPNVPGYANATFASFGEPITSPNGSLVFPAKLGGGVPKAKANTVWSTLGGSPKMVLQQGTPLPGLTSVNLTSVTSLSVRDSHILALVKVNGDPLQNVVLLRLDSAGNGTVLLRTGQAVKSITALTSSATSPGDGRWQSDTDAITKVGFTNKSTSIYRVSSTGIANPILATVQAPPQGITGTWKTFGLPAITHDGKNVAVLGTLNLGSGITAANDTALVQSLNSGAFTKLAYEGEGAGSLSANLNFAGFSDPLIDATGKAAFIATLKAAPGKPATTGLNNKALFFGPANSLVAIARTGDNAPDAGGSPTTAKYGALSSFVLPDGALNSPIFTAKLSGPGVNAANNFAVFATDHNTGKVRRLLRTGDLLGAQKVSKITLLKAVPQEFSAARSFNQDGGVVMLVNFTDHSTGILRIDVP